MLSILVLRLPRLSRIWLFCSMTSSYTELAFSLPADSWEHRHARKADLQADLHEIDEPAKLFDDLVARIRKLVRPDNLATRNSYASAASRR